MGEKDSNLKQTNSGGLLPTQTESDDASCNLKNSRISRVLPYVVSLLRRWFSVTGLNSPPLSVWTWFNQNLFRSRGPGAIRKFVTVFGTLLLLSLVVLGSLPNLPWFNRQTPDPGPGNWECVCDGGKAVSGPACPYEGA